MAFLKKYLINTAQSFLKNFGAISTNQVFVYSKRIERHRPQFKRYTRQSN